MLLWRRGLREGKRGERERESFVEDIELKWPLGAHSTIPLSLALAASLSLLFISSESTSFSSFCLSLSPSFARTQQTLSHLPRLTAILYIPSPSVSLSSRARFSLKPHDRSRPAVSSFGLSLDFCSLSFYFAILLHSTVSGRVARCAARLARGVGFSNKDNMRYSVLFSLFAIYSESQHFFVTSRTLRSTLNIFTWKMF